MGAWGETEQWASAAKLVQRARRIAARPACMSLPACLPAWPVARPRNPPPGCFNHALCSLACPGPRPAHLMDDGKHGEMNNGRNLFGDFSEVAERIGGECVGRRAGCSRRGAVQHTGCQGPPRRLCSVPAHLFSSAPFFARPALPRFLAAPTVQLSCPLLLLLTCNNPLNLPMPATAAAALGTRWASPQPPPPPTPLSPPSVQRL